MQSDIEIVEKLTIIIRMQADIISGLYNLLGQYMPAEELDDMPFAEKINEAAAIRNDILREP